MKNIKQIFSCFQEFLHTSKNSQYLNSPIGEQIFEMSIMAIQSYDIMDDASDLLCRIISVFSKETQEGQLAFFTIMAQKLANLLLKYLWITKN